MTTTPNGKKPAIKITRHNGRTSKLTLTIEWSAKTTPSEEQRRIWERIGATLAQILTPEEQADFLSRFKEAIAPREAKS